MSAWLVPKSDCNICFCYILFCRKLIPAWILRFLQGLVIFQRFRSSLHLCMRRTSLKSHLNLKCRKCWSIGIYMIISMLRYMLGTTRQSTSLKIDIQLRCSSVKCDMHVTLVRKLMELTFARIRRKTYVSITRKVLTMHKWCAQASNGGRKYFMSLT